MQMKPDCQCDKCTIKINEYFFPACFHNFNKCESFYEYHEPTGNLPTVGTVLCPKCHPKIEVTNLRVEYGGILRCRTSDGRIINMADEMNRLENEN